MAKRKLKKCPASKVVIFKIKNRRGFAALCLKHLTEGRTPVLAFYRMIKALKRSGLLLEGKVPRPR